MADELPRWNIKLYVALEGLLLLFMKNKEEK